VYTGRQCAGYNPHKEYPHPAADQLVGLSGYQYYGMQKSSLFLDHQTLLEALFDPGEWNVIGHKYIDFIFPWSGYQHPQVRRYQIQLKYPDYKYLLNPNVNSVFLNMLLDDIDIVLRMKDIGFDIINGAKHDIFRAEQFYCSIEIFYQMAWITNQRKFIRKIESALLHIRDNYQQFDCNHFLMMACDHQLQSKL